MANRINPIAAPSSPASAVSPTGSPMVPVKLVPYLGALVALASAGVLYLPPHTVGHKIAAGIVALGGLFGIFSPGLRR